jgi:hypothetical protein
MIFMIVGMLLKSGLLLLWHFASLRPVIQRSIELDGTVWLAFRACTLLFDPRREIPAPIEPAVFYSMLVLGTGIELLSIGFVVGGIRSWFRPTEPEPSPNGAPIP